MPLFALHPRPGVVCICVEQEWVSYPLWLPRGHHLSMWDVPSRQNAVKKNEFPLPFTFPVLFLMSDEPNLLLLELLGLWCQGNKE